MYDLRSEEEPSTTERPEFPDLPRRRRYENDLDDQRHAVRWVIGFLVAIAIGALCWYGYPMLKQVPGLLAQFPTMQKSVDGITARLGNAEAQIKTWSNGQQQLQNHVAEVEKNLTAGLHGVRKQVQDAGERVYQRVHGEVTAENEATRSEIAQLRSAGEADRTNVAKLQTEVATLREETARQAEQLRNVRTDMERNGASRDQEFVSLNQQLGRDTRGLEDINHKLAVKRVDFEVTRNHTRQLTDEISLGVTGTDVSHRRVTGWMWIMPDHRTVWLRKQQALEPIVFYGKTDGKRRELVITNVARNSVSGYLILPGESGTGSSSKGD